MPRSELVRNSRLSIALFHHGDEEHLRLGEPTLTPAFRESMIEYERKMSTRLSKVGNMLELHPHEPSMTIKQVGLETTELMAMAPAGSTLEQVKRGLIIAEFEDMVGYIADAEGKGVLQSAWDMDELAIDSYVYQKDHSPEALRDLLTKAMSMQPQVLCHRACIYVYAYACMYVYMCARQNDLC